MARLQPRDDPPGGYLNLVTKVFVGMIPAIVSPETQISKTNISSGKFPPGSLFRLGSAREAQMVGTFSRRWCTARSWGQVLGAPTGTPNSLQLTMSQHVSTNGLTTYVPNSPQLRPPHELSAYMLPETLNQ